MTRRRFDWESSERDRVDPLRLLLLLQFSVTIRSIDRRMRKQNQINRIAESIKPKPESNFSNQIHTDLGDDRSAVTYLIGFVKLTEAVNVKDLQRWESKSWNSEEEEIEILWEWKSNEPDWGRSRWSRWTLQSWWNRRIPPELSSSLLLLPSFFFVDFSLLSQPCLLLAKDTETTYCEV